MSYAVANPSRLAADRERDAAIVQRDFARAGFVLESESDVLRNLKDDHSLGVFDPAIYSHTDRFTLRFRRPTK